MNLEKAKAVFFELVANVPAEQWDARLAELAGDDEELRRRVSLLLAAHRDEGSFLDSPAAALGPTIDQPIHEAPGTVIGPYKLLEQIGEGGFGIVFMAEQTEPVRRKVALKILKPGMDSRQVIARFEAERQALAIMDHPNIAKVFDGGATDSGRPYFVMELVKGVPITEFCDQNHLTPRQRLELFVPVCQAVQHAHHKGIIHRDLKPSNVLVSRHDATPVVKVIDFGVAKALGQVLTDKTLFTGIAQMIGTPLYMSPEQAGMSDLDVDTRSDIYSLGVLLYELLTGSTPFSKERFKLAAYDEIRRIIREEEPPKPSTRLSDSTDSLPSISAQRHTEPAKLTKLVRGELDWIVMKALEKDRSRRYETANGFAADVQRYLAGEAVRAVPPSVGYRVRKFARRNRSKLVASGVLAAAFLVAVAGIGWAVRDRSARQADAERERNERQARVTTQVELILADVERLQKEQKWDEALAVAKRAEVAIAGDEAQEATRAKVAEAAKELEFVNQLEQIRIAASAIRGDKFDFAGAVRGYGEAFRTFGVDVESLPSEVAEARLKHHERIALPIAAALDNWINSRRQAFGMEEVGWQPLLVLAKQLDPDRLRNRLRDLWGRKVTPELQAELRKLTESIDIRSQTPGTLTILAETLERTQLVDLEEQVLRQAQCEYPGDFWLNNALGSAVLKRKKYDEAARFFSTALGTKPTSTAAWSNLGAALDKQKKQVEAIACFRKAIEIDPKNVHAHNNLGSVLCDQKKLDEASVSYRRAIELDPKNAVAHTGLGNVWHDQGKFEEAISSHRKALELDPIYAPAHTNLGSVFRDQGRFEEAISSHRRALDLDPQNGMYHFNLGTGLLSQNKVDEAIASNRKAIELDPKLARAHSDLGLCLSRKGEWDAAIACYRTAIKLDPKYSIAHYNLGIALEVQGKVDDAIASYRAAIEIDPKYTLAHCDLGNVLHGQGKLDDAIACYRKAIEFDPKHVHALHNLGVALYAQGKVDEAIACFRRIIEHDPKLASAHSNLGAALSRQGKLDEAIACFRRTIELDPKFASAHSNLGNALRDQTKLDEANVYLRKAIELDPKNALAHNNLGLVLHDLKNLDEAIASYRRAIDLDPKYANAHRNLGDALQTQGKVDEAIACYRTAIKLDPKDAAAHTNLGVALKVQGSLDEAIACYRTAIKLDPKYAAAHTNLGVALKVQGSLDEAIACFRTASNLDPKYAAAHFNLGNALSDQGKLDEAIACFRTASNLEPKNAVARRSLAVVLAKKGSLDEAIAASRIAIEIDPKYAIAHNDLGYYLNRQGKRDAAIASFRTAIEIDPIYLEAIQNLATALMGKGDRAGAMQAFRRVSELDPRNAYSLGNLAWFLTTIQDPKLRNHQESLALARKSVTIAPAFWNMDTLSLVAFRCGEWKESLDTRLKMIKLQPARTEDKFFLSMNHWHLGNKDEARKWYTEASAEFAKLPNRNAWLTGIKKEAEALLGTDEQTPRERLTVPPRIVK